LSGLLPRQLRGDPDGMASGRAGDDESGSTDAGAVDGDDATGR
jgi:hypothetical protein